MSEKSVKPSRKADIVKVILAILAVLLGTYMFVDPGKQPTYEPNPALVKKIDSLQAVNDRLSEINDTLETMLVSYEDVINQLDYKIEELQKYKKSVTDYYKKRSEELVNETPSDIDTFFMNRYQYVNDSE